MSLHRLTAITVGVPNVEETCGFYRDFGLSETSPGRFSTLDGGEQLRIAQSPRRNLLEIGVGVDDPDDLERIARSLERLEIACTREGEGIIARVPGAAARVRVEIAPRLEEKPEPPLALNAPGRPDRPNTRSPSLLRSEPVRPRALSHVVLGTPETRAAVQFFTDGLGFKVSDRVGDQLAFMRCSDHHHNVLVQPAPVDFMHHSAWEVEDVDEVGRGADAILEKHPASHVWGLGRHYIGSNYFWYVKDPAGNFAEYTSDLDVIIDDEKWDPGVFDLGKRALAGWGPPVPREFIAPRDIHERVA